MFTDLKKNRWSTDFTLAKCLDPKAPFDLLDLQSVIETMQDPRKFVRALYWLTDANAPDDLSFEDFAAGFDGNVLEDAAKSVFESIKNFSPSDRRESIAQLVTKMEELGRAELDKTRAIIAQLGAETNGPATLSSVAQPSE